MVVRREKSSALQRNDERKLTNAFQWDGVIFCDYYGERKLFLVEAKTTVAVFSISDMKARIDKTKKFIESCPDLDKHFEDNRSTARQKNPAKKAANDAKYEANSILRALWGAFSDCSIEAVIAGTTFTPKNMSEIEENNYFGICMDEETYRIFNGKVISSFCIE